MSDATGAPFKLQVAAQIRQTFRYVFANFWRIFSWSLLGLILYFVLSIPGSLMEDDTDLSAAPWAFLLSILGGLVIAPVGAAVMRGAILDENYSTGYIATFSTGYFWKFVLAGIYWAVCAVALVIPIAIAGYVLVYLPMFGLREPGESWSDIDNLGLAFGVYAAIMLFFLYLYLVMRLSLMMPMQAVGRAGWVKASWQLSRGNGLRMALIAFVMSILLTLIFSAVVLAIALALAAGGQLTGAGDVAGDLLDPLSGPASGGLSIYIVLGLIPALALSAFYTIVSIALNAGVLGFVYKALEAGRTGD